MNWQSFTQCCHPFRLWRLRIKALAATLQVALLAILIPSLLAQSVPRIPDDTKAGLVLTFAMLTHWPTNAFADPDAPFVVGVLGEDPILRALTDKSPAHKLQDRKVLVRQVNDSAGARQCHVLFLGSGQTNRFENILGDLRDSSVLTVSDAKPFLELGGMINLDVEKRERDTYKPCFDVNWGAAKRVQLKLRAELLKKARRVIEQEEN